MSKQRIEKQSSSNEKCNKSMDDQDGNSSAVLSTKLERRRRIEDLNEEKRLRDELTPY